MLIYIYSDKELVLVSSLLHKCLYNSSYVKNGTANKVYDFYIRLKCVV